MSWFVHSHTGAPALTCWGKRHICCCYLLRSHEVMWRSQYCCYDDRLSVVCNVIGCYLVQLDKRNENVIRWQFTVSFCDNSLSINWNAATFEDMTKKIYISSYFTSYLASQNNPGQHKVQEINTVPNKRHDIVHARDPCLNIAYLPPNFSPWWKNKMGVNHNLLFKSMDWSSF